MCPFANRQGGNIFLGVEDDGTVSGVPKGSALSVKRITANVLDDPNLFRPSPLVEVGDVDCDGALVIRVWAPMDPAVYTYKGTVYDRLADTDTRITGVDQISLMYLRKQNTFSERRISNIYLLNSLCPFLGGTRNGTNKPVSITSHRSLLFACWKGKPLFYLRK